MTVPYTAARGERRVWLLDLDIGGRILRVATEPVSVTGADGATYAYTSGLSMPSTVLGQDQDSLSLEVDDRATNWAKHAARGHRIARRDGTVSLWYSGIAAPVVLFRGGVDLPEWGFPDSPTRLAITLRAEFDGERKLYPPPSEVVDETTWAQSWQTGTGQSSDPAIVGQVYPTVLGIPGTGNTAAANPNWGTPALNVQGHQASQGWLLICRGLVEATNVRIWEINEHDANNAMLYEDNAVATATDLLGQTVSYVEYPAALGKRAIWGNQFHVGFSSHASFGGGGMLGPDGTLLRDLGDVITWALGEAGVNYDHGRQAAQAEQLAPFKIDTHIAGGRFDLEAWLSRQVSRVFPIRRVRGPDGIYFAYVDYTPGLDQAVAWLDADKRQVERVSSITVASAPMASQFEIRYARNSSTGTYTRKRFLAPEHSEINSLTNTSVIGSTLCAQARAYLGRDVMAPPIETELTWDDNTAELILHHRAARDALGRRVVQYSGRHLTHLLPYQVVALTDSDVFLSEVPALIERIEYSGPETTLTLSLLDSDFRTS